MANLNIEAVPSDDLRRYRFSIDGNAVNMGANNKGSFTLPNNTCDDGSEHRVTYALVGPAGSKLSFNVTCDDEVEVQIDDVMVYPEGEPYAAGWRDFTL